MRLGRYVAIADKLTGEYKEAFDYIDAFSDAYMNGGKYKNEKMMDLLDILLTAQEEGQQVEKVLGTDLDKFSNDFFSDRTFYDVIEPAFSKIKVLAWLLLILEGLYIFSILGEPDFNIFTTKSDVSSYVALILLLYLGIIFTDLISAILIKLKCFSSKKYLVMSIVFTVIALGLFFLAMICDSQVIILTFPLIVVSVAYLIAYYGLRFYLRYKKTGTLKKSADDYETNFSGLVREEYKKTDYSRDKSILKTYSKAYKKANRRRERKGLEPLSTEEFMRKREKQNKYAFPIASGIGFVMSFFAVFFSRESDNPFYSIWFVVFFIVMLFLFYWFIIRGISKISSRVNKSILETCKEEGLEVDELYEKYKDLQNDKTEQDSKLETKE